MCNLSVPWSPIHTGRITGPSAHPGRARSALRCATQAHVPGGALFWTKTQRHPGRPTESLRRAGPSFHPRPRRPRVRSHHPGSGKDSAAHLTHLAPRAAPPRPAPPARPRLLAAVFGAPGAVVTSAAAPPAPAARPVSVRGARALALGLRARRGGGRAAGS